MPDSHTITESFRKLNFHEDTLIDLRVLPAQRREDGANSVIEIQLHQYSGKELRRIRFTGCTNLRVAMDFDVLAGNFPTNTSRLDAHTDANRIRKLMQSQKRDWDVVYAPGETTPLTTKLAALDGLVSFRVQFFGGAVDIIARDYRVEMSAKDEHEVG